MVCITDLKRVYSVLKPVPNGHKRLCEKITAYIEVVMRYVWCGVLWCGVVWCGVVWCGVVWCGVVWCGVVWHGVV